jgi:hypothetical protein
MGFFHTLAGRDPGPAPLPYEEGGRFQPPRLIVKTRCVLVADVVAIDADGKRETVVSGLDEDAAREVFLELTGRPWTRVEADQ